HRAGGLDTVGQVRANGVQNVRRIGVEVLMEQEPLGLGRRQLNLHEAADMGRAAVVERNANGIILRAAFFGADRIVGLNGAGVSPDRGEALEVVASAVDDGYLAGDGLTDLPVLV